MALWQDIPGKSTRIDRKNLSRLEKFSQASINEESDYFVNFDGANGLDNYDIVRITFIDAIDENKQAKLSIDNGNNYYDIEVLTGKEVQGKEIELVFKDNKWERIVPGDTLAGMLDYFYPVGTIYETTSTDLDTTTKMGNHFGGTWEVYGAGRVLVGVDTSQTEFNAIGKTGGAKTHTLTIAQMPSHGHASPKSSTGISLTLPTGGGDVSHVIINPDFRNTWGSNLSIPNNGGGQAHNNLQPYIVVYRYRRTA